MSQLWQKRELLQELSVDVVMITFEAQEAAKHYRRISPISWPILIDEKRELYHRYAMYQASMLDIWGIKTLWAYMVEIVKGNFPKRSTGDIHQRGGDVLIDDKGIVRLHYVGSGPADRPPVGEILTHIHRMQSSLPKQGDCHGRSREN